MTALLSTDFCYETQTLTWHVEVATRAGTTAASNQDRFSINEGIALFTLADGLSGRMHGEVAAELVTQGMPVRLRHSRQRQPLATPARQLKAALEATSMDVRTHARRYLHDCMGATAVAVWLTQGQGVVTHLGDSRAYLLRDGILRRLTCDHSLAELLFECGDLPREALRTSPLAHRLTRFCGMEGEPLVEVCTISLKAGDRFLLCSDGLSRTLDDHTLRQLCQSSHPAQALIDAVQHAKGHDDATALVVHIGEKEVAR